VVQELPLESRYEIDIAWSDEDEAFVARIPELPFAGAHGDTLEEALAMAKSAIRAYLEVAEELGKPIPEPGRHNPDETLHARERGFELAQTIIDQQRVLQDLIGGSMSVYATLLSSSLYSYQESLRAMATVLQASAELPAQAALESVRAANEAAQQIARAANQTAEQVARAANQAAQRAAQDAAQSGGHELPGKEDPRSAPTTP
jgi:predicted RNase H-like HicB family nuclease